MQRAPKRSLHGGGRVAQGVRRRMAPAPKAAGRHMLGASLPISGGTCNVLQPRRVYSEAHAIAEMQKQGPLAVDSCMQASCEASAECSW